jgi:hypothetical protein
MMSSWKQSFWSPERLCYDVLKHVDGINVFPKLDVYNRRQLKVMVHSSRVSDATKKNQEALQRLDALNKRSLTASQLNEGEGDQGTHEPVFNNNEVQDANSAAGEEEAVAADRVENTGTAEQGESFGATGRQENVREPEVNAGGEKRRQRMVPKMPLDHRGIDPRAFRTQHQRYVGAYHIHVDLPAPDSQKRKGVTRQADKLIRARRKCATCRRFDCNGAKTRLKKGESKECQYPPASSR